jgi:hypothetical protein
MIFWDEKEIINFLKALEATDYEIKGATAFFVPSGG